MATFKNETRHAFYSDMLRIPRSVQETLVFEAINEADASANRDDVDTLCRIIVAKRTEPVE